MAWMALVVVVVVGSSIAGSSSTMRRTRSGCAASNRNARLPPSECPTTSTAEFQPTLSITSIKSSTWVSRFHGASRSDRPCPRRSGATTCRSKRYSEHSRSNRRPCAVMPWMASNGVPSWGPERCTCSKAMMSIMAVSVQCVVAVCWWVGSYFVASTSALRPLANCSTSDSVVSKLHTHRT